MSEQTILLKVLQFTTAELECLLKTAIKLLYIDGIADITEWSIISLVPALLEIEQENASPELKEQWQTKVAAVSKVIEEQDPDQAIGELQVHAAVTEPEKRETFLIILFMVAFADNKLNRIELNFIYNNIARPWGLNVDNLVELITRHRESVAGADEIIQLLQSSTFF